MRKLILPIVLFYILFAFSNCTPVSYIQTETLEPAEIGIPSNINSVVLLLRTPENDFDVVDTDTFPSLLLEEIKYGMADVLVNSPRFDSEQIVIPDQDEIKEFVEKDTLTWLELKSITDKYGTDALIILDKFALKPKMTTEWKYYYGDLYNFVTLRINSNAYWKIYYPYTDQLVDEHNYSEKFLWEAYGSNKESAVANLPEFKVTFREASYWTGYDYAKRIMPTWLKTTRGYYITGTENFRKAAELVDSSKWESAIELWKKDLEHSDKEIVSRAAYNIAFGFEMLGNMNAAISWAKKSHKIKPKERVRKYIEILEERKKTLQKLQKQVH